MLTVAFCNVNDSVDLSLSININSYDMVEMDHFYNFRCVRNHLNVLLEYIILILTTMKNQK